MSRSVSDADPGVMIGPSLRQWILAAGLSSVFLVGSLPVSADYYAHGRRGYYGPGPGRHYWYGPAPRFYGRAWYGGRWYHGWFGGRPSWWWIVGSTWYLYPAPVYPYPDPSAVPIESLPAPAPLPAPQQAWYWCNDPAGYYPAVAGCSQPWAVVSAGAPVAPPAPAGSADAPPSPYPPAGAPADTGPPPGFDPSQAPPAGPPPN